MLSGVYNIRSKGNLLNCYEFEWDLIKEFKFYVIVSSFWIFIGCLLFI